jgi:hypothetical protein
VPSWNDLDGDSSAVKKALKIILWVIALSIVACLIAVGPVALIFPVYFPFCFYVYVFHPLLSYPLMFAASLLACFLGGYFLSRWPTKQLRYTLIPVAVMGLTMAWVTPQACGFDPFLFSTFMKSALFLGLAVITARIKEYETLICGVLALYCGIALGLQVHVALCHNDYSPDAGLIAVSGRGGAWLSVLAAMAFGWLSAWIGTRVHRSFPPTRGMPAGRIRN